MNAKEMLTQIKLLDSKIDAEVNELISLKDRLQTLIFLSGTEMEKIQREISELEKIIESDVEKWTAVKKQTLEILGEIRNPKIYSIMYCRYFQYMTWEKLAEKLEISIEWARKLHCRGLKIVDDILQKNPDSCLKLGIDV